MALARFVVGIDLGTTNIALAYVDTGVGEEEDVRPTHLFIPQVVQPGSVEDRPLLPSYLYLPGPNELPAGSLQLPWDANRDFAVGEFARQQGGVVPTRLVSSAKSWLCHPGIDRKAAVLPWKAPDKARRVSPLEVGHDVSQASCRGVEPQDRQGPARESPGASGHHSDGAGVVRRGGPRADGRGRPCRRLRERHAARGAAGRVLRLDRRQRR